MWLVTILDIISHSFIHSSFINDESSDITFFSINAMNILQEISLENSKKVFSHLCKISNQIFSFFFFFLCRFSFENSIFFATFLFENQGENTGLKKNVHRWQQQFDDKPHITTVIHIKQSKEKNLNDHCHYEFCFGYS